MAYNSLVKKKKKPGETETEINTATVAGARWLYDGPMCNSPQVYACLKFFIIKHFQS